MIVLTAAAIGSAFGAAMSVIFNDARDISLHLQCAIITAGYCAVIGGLIALARWQRRR